MNSKLSVQVISGIWILFVVQLAGCSSPAPKGQPSLNDTVVEGMRLNKDWSHDLNEHQLKLIVESNVFAWQARSLALNEMVERRSVKAKDLEVLFAKEDDLLFPVPILQGLERIADQPDKETLRDLTMDLEERATKLPTVAFDGWCRYLQKQGVDISGILKKRIIYLKDQATRLGSLTDVPKPTSLELKDFSSRPSFQASP